MAGIDGRAAIGAEEAALAFEAFALLAAAIHIRAQLGDVLRACATHSAWPRASQPHAHRAMHKGSREMMHAEGAVPAMLAA
ncbi:MAG TPA: hypothetical protein VHU23_09970 [Rhizomicrobium sp.]|nr:hypothetical protein [Rhizomicrobium sp.]